MLRKVLLLAAVFVAALAATLLYLSRPASSRMADWAGARVGSTSARFRPGAVSGSEVRLGQQDLSELVRAALEDHENGRRALRLVKELKTEIAGGRVEIGVVLNLGEIPREELTEDEIETIGRVLGFLPFLADQDLYVGVSGIPTASAGLVTVERDLKVKLAALTLPLAEMGALFGVDTEPLREELVLDLSPFHAREVEILPGEVVIRLAVAG